MIDQNQYSAETEINRNFGSTIYEPKPKPKFLHIFCRNLNLSLNMGYLNFYSGLALVALNRKIIAINFDSDQNFTNKILRLN